MALKKKLNKSEFDKLSDAIKQEYIEDGEGYRLDVDGEEDKETAKLLHQTIQKVEYDIEHMKFNTGISALMVFNNLAKKNFFIPSSSNISLIIS